MFLGLNQYAFIFFERINEVLTVIYLPTGKYAIKYFPVSSLKGSVISFVYKSKLTVVQNQE